MLRVHQFSMQHLYMNVSNVLHQTGFSLATFFGWLFCYNSKLVSIVIYFSVDALFP